jgi:hypothetical protein
VAEPRPPFPWRPGEHVAVVGDTGTGKTWLLAKGLLRMRHYVVVFKTKPDKDDDDKWRGFHRIRTAKGMQDTRHTRFLLEPKYAMQAIEGWRMLESVWRQGGWTCVIDEGWYAEQLGLRPYVDRLLTQGRSQDISVVYGQQRPVETSRFVISQCSHLFSFRVEGRDAKTIAESTTPRILPVIDSLTGYRFAYYHRPTRTVATGDTSRLGAVIAQPGREIVPKIVPQTA